jgi:hypothetical protein
VSDDYFRVAGVPVLLGRQFEAGDRLDSARVAVLNEKAARLFFPKENPLGQSVRIWDDQDRRIVGVVGNVHFLGLRQDTEPAIYAAYFQMPTGFCNLLVKTALGEDELQLGVRAALDRIDPRVPLSRPRDLEEMLAEPLARVRAGASLASLIASIVLLISVIGLYALMAASAAAWRAEFCVRSVVGATRGQIVALVTWRGLRVLAAGTLIGCVATLGVRRLLVLLYSVGAGLTYLQLFAVAVATAAAALPALLLPAVRASKLNPTALLRRE